LSDRIRQMSPHRPVHRWTWGFQAWQPDCLLHSWHLPHFWARAESSSRWHDWGVLEISYLVTFCFFRNEPITHQPPWSFPGKSVGQEGVRLVCTWSCSGRARTRSLIDGSFCQVLGTLLPTQGRLWFGSP
jgi:hypothetical protein